MARKASTPRRPKRRSADAEPVIVGEHAEPPFSGHPSKDENLLLEDDAADPAAIEVSDFHPLEPDADAP
ncbi:MAG: hypothetical protein WBE78_06380, partial [Candidatus Binataceae bacterium]